jgi:hypothetical protein
MVSNATFNNISVISWRSVLLVEETRVLGENHRPAANHLQTFSKFVFVATCLRIKIKLTSLQVNFTFKCTKSNCFFWPLSDYNQLWIDLWMSSVVRSFPEIFSHIFVHHRVMETTKGVVLSFYPLLESLPKDI